MVNASPSKIQDALESGNTTLHGVSEDLAEIQSLLRLAKELEKNRSPDSLLDAKSAAYLLTLQNKLADFHAADIARLLEALPVDDRLFLWTQVPAADEGEILLEVSDAVRESLIAHMAPAELVAATETLDADEIADLAPDLPNKVIQDVFQALSVEEREQLRAAMSFDEDAVGALMDFDMVTVRDDVTLEVVLRYLRRFDDLPDHTDQLFVIDRQEHLLGVLPLNRLLVSDPDLAVAMVVTESPIVLHQQERAAEAAAAFERYDLVSAPVVDDQGKLVGRVTVNAVLDLIRSSSEEELLSQAGLREEEDIFASVWKSFQNRWAWLAINLITAFISSRVIGIFEGTIAKLVALAALMPIVAGIGGNSGNQTITMIVRAMAMGQVNRVHLQPLLIKELQVAIVNGLVWGGVMGGVAYSLYHQVSIGVVMVAAMTLNLVLAACAGVLIPMAMMRFGRDPALGSSVLITAVTDSGGFLIFLGLATLFLI